MPRTISTEEVRGMLDDEGTFYKFIDLSPPENFERFHLPNAINVPLGRGALGKICRLAQDHEETLVLYSQEKDAPEVWKLAVELEARGYPEVLDYKAGEKIWISKGLPVDPPTP